MVEVRHGAGSPPVPAPLHPVYLTVETDVDIVRRLFPRHIPGRVHVLKTGTDIQGGWASDSEARAFLIEGIN